MDFLDSVFADQDKQRRERSVNGIAIAKVTGRMGDGTYTVKYLGMGGDAPSAPARMMMPNAGKQRGMYWMPETGDEVVVAFEGGDSNSPIILGALFNSESPTPDQAKPSDENNVRTIVSRSGHEITLDDSPLAGKVTIKTNGGRSLTLDDTPLGKVSLETPSGISIEMDDSTGTLKLKAPTAIVLESAIVSMNIDTALNVTSGLISMTAPAGITLTTMGAMPGLVMIDGKIFGLHVHGLPPPAVPVTPPVYPG
jgi:phage baseplate assembly protein gpV